MIAGVWTAPQPHYPCRGMCAPAVDQPLPTVQTQGNYADWESQCLTVVCLMAGLNSCDSKLCKLTAVAMLCTERLDGACICCCIYVSPNRDCSPVERNPRHSSSTGNINSTACDVNGSAIGESLGHAAAVSNNMRILLCASACWHKFRQSSAKPWCASGYERCSIC